MFRVNALSFLCCPACGAERLEHSIFDAPNEHELLNAVVWCAQCRAWFPVEGGVLDLLQGKLAYHEDRKRFAERHATELRKLELSAAVEGEAADSELQSKQQAHFDWYSANDTQSYLQYEQMPFWEATDAITFSRWLPQIRPNGWLLDVGCGNGRSTFKIADVDTNVLAFDVSKGAIRQAEARSREGAHQAKLSFFTADATRFPVRSAALDYVLIYGVLHHVPDPRVACREVARVLKPGGVYFGSENNQTIFRTVFDALQKLKPLWYEEAGPEALISDKTIRDAFAASGMSLNTQSIVFVPPHLINLLPRRWGPTVLQVSDRIGATLPGVSRNGGLILIEGVKDKLVGSNTMSSARA